MTRRNEETSGPLPGTPPEPQAAARSSRAARSQPRLPGMPEPPAARITQALAIERAIERLHDELVPLLESLPAFDGARGEIRIRQKVGGDTVSVSIVLGQERS